MDELLSAASSAVINTFAQTGRTAVSKDKFRYQKDGLDLDLTYITNRIIAMGLPGESVDKLWRNDIDDVAKFFNMYHKGHFRVFNLSGLPYDYEKLNHCVRDFGWPDHSAPPLKILLEVVDAIILYLKEHSKNVAAVHCLAGRGRTGTVISCALIKLGMFHSATASLDFFAAQRSSIKSGVLTPSQIRFARYFEDIHLGRVPACVHGREKELRVARIEINPCISIPGSSQKDYTGTTGCTPIVQISRLHANVIYQTPKANAATFTKTHYPRIEMEISDESRRVVVKGNVQVKVFHRVKGKKSFLNILTKSSLTPMEKASATKESRALVPLFRFSFHTNWIDDTYELVLVRSALDSHQSGSAENNGLLPPSLTVVLYFEDPSEPLGNSYVKRRNSTSAPPIGAPVSSTAHIMGEATSPTLKESPYNHHPSTSSTSHVVTTRITKSSTFSPPSSVVTMPSTTSVSPTQTWETPYHHPTQYSITPSHTVLPSSAALVQHNIDPRNQYPPNIDSSYLYQQPLTSTTTTTNAGGTYYYQCNRTNMPPPSYTTTWHTQSAPWPSPYVSHNPYNINASTAAPLPPPRPHLNTHHMWYSSPSISTHLFSTPTSTPPPDDDDVLHFPAPRE